MRSPHYIVSYGSDALLLNWEQRIDPTISTSIHAWAVEIKRHPAVRECVPGYASLLVRFAAPLVSAYDLREFILELKPEKSEQKKTLTHKLPVCYNGPDLQETAKVLKLSTTELIQLHADQEYLVYQIGFRPGFGFLGQTAPELEVARRATPRARVPAGSVGLAGRQTGVYPTEGPGGWQLIGRCPYPLLRSGDHPSLLRAGDTVRFHPVTEAEFSDLLNSPPPWPER